MNGAVPTALYRPFGDDDALLYIGISETFGRRWTQHAQVQPWWPEVRRQAIDWLSDRDSAEDAEREAIKVERPRYNILHNQENPERYDPAASAVARERLLRAGALVRSLRRERGVSQADLAAEMRANGWPWHQTTVNKTERGERALRFGEAADLAALSGLSINEFTEAFRRGAA
jgi:ribosome-binding protein aMBF1 (putative translation factor)